MTLIEVSVAIAVLAVAAIGALNYQYHATRRGLLARSEITATRIAQLLLEDWKSRGADETYDPIDLEMGFEASKVIDWYRVTIDRLPMMVNLRWEDVSRDSEAGVTLREIRVEVRWRLDRTDGGIRDGDPGYVMTTLVRMDQSAG